MCCSSARTRAVRAAAHVGAGAGRAWRSPAPGFRLPPTAVAATCLPGWARCAGAYPYTGRVEEVGVGTGEGATINVPLPADSGGCARCGLRCFWPTCLCHCLPAASAMHGVLCVSIALPPYLERPGPHQHPQATPPSWRHSSRWWPPRPAASGPTSSSSAPAMTRTGETRWRVGGHGRAVAQAGGGRSLARQQGRQGLRLPPCLPQLTAPPLPLPPPTCGPCRPAVPVGHLLRPGRRAGGSGGRAVRRAPAVPAGRGVRPEGPGGERGQHVAGWVQAWRRGGVYTAAWLVLR